MSEPRKYKLVCLVYDNNTKEGEELYTIPELKTYLAPYGLPTGLKVESIDIVEIDAAEIVREVVVEKQIVDNDLFVLRSITDGKVYKPIGKPPKGLYQVEYPNGG
jgi:hypothetical protein